MISDIDILITVPVYNEEKQLRTKIYELNNYALKNLREYRYKIVIAENGSKDSTSYIASHLAKELKLVEFYKHPEQGRGKALYSLWLQEKARCYIYMDVDLATDVNHTLELANSIMRKGYDVSIGSRNLNDSRVHRGLKRTTISKGYILLLRLIFGIKSSDTQCGFKALSSDAKERLWPLLNPDNWTGAAWFFDAELIILAEKIGLKIHEIPVKWNEAPGTTVSIANTIKEDLSGIYRLLKTKPWKNQKV
ncbi:MAG: glycosyltransferase [Candidatus Dojkabacteria bacterium]|jgi:glycosyltransferase involved in cell wall biosynthesis|nr:glycosyltransferase [Candidatus Dojkabacteria bacterium]